MADPSDIKYAEQLLMRNLMEWRDAGGSVESVTGAILRLIVAREAFATMVRAEKETGTAPKVCPHGYSLDELSTGASICRGCCGHVFVGNSDNPGYFWCTKCGQESG